MPGLLWFAGAVLMMAEFGDAARAATPDLLCSVLFLGGLFAYVRGREVAAAILLFLAFMARPDSIVFLAIFAVLLVGYRQKAWGALAGFAASLVAYFASSHWAQHPGWWPHLWFSSVEQHYNMDGFDPPFSAAAYLRAFAVFLVRAVRLNSWVGISVLALAGGMRPAAPASSSTAVPASCLRHWCSACWRSLPSSRSATPASIFPI